MQFSPSKAYIYQYYTFNLCFTIHIYSNFQITILPSVVKQAIKCPSAKYPMNRRMGFNENLKVIIG